LEYVRLLGQGGFADVFLYQQAFPSRRVAVKVLIPQFLDAEAIDRLYAEANAMAELSAHPNIVTIHTTGISEDGRPYLVMEYCPGPSLSPTRPGRAMPVAEALSIGVEIAGAVETAHRLGVLHRDIKPSNILVTSYGHHALTDFGIATTTAAGGGSSAESGGVSVPYAPPEAFAPVAWSGPASDIWSLAATIYAMVAGRTPFEVPGQDNSANTLAERICRDPLPPLNQQGAADGLYRVLAAAMAKDPRDRYPTAAAFGQALRRLQQDLGFAPTQMVILDQSGPGADQPPSEYTQATALRPVTLPAYSTTPTPQPLTQPPLVQPRPPEAGGRAGLVVALAAGLALLLGGLSLVIWALAGGGSDKKASGTATASASEAAEVTEAYTDSVPATFMWGADCYGLSCTYSGVPVLTWDAGSDWPFKWRRVDTDGKKVTDWTNGQLTDAAAEGHYQFSLGVELDDTECVEIKQVDQDGNVVADAMDDALGNRMPSWFTVCALPWDIDWPYVEVDVETNGDGQLSLVNGLKADQVALWRVEYCQRPVDPEAEDPTSDFDLDFDVDASCAGDLMDMGVVQQMPVEFNVPRGDLTTGVPSTFGPDMTVHGNASVIRYIKVTGNLIEMQAVEVVNILTGYYVY
jgi:hypothetical protein